MSYQVPAGIFESEYIVKKSRFIARIVPVGSREEVNAAVQQARQDYPDARHHCWAYLLGKPVDAAGAGMSDDGEPAGTAGKPILNVLQHGQMGDVLVVVIRYFGGIKLGAGGLVRAYSATTGQALDEAPAITRRALARFCITGDFSAEQAVRHLLPELAGELLDVEYGSRVNLTVAIPSGVTQSLQSFCDANSLILQALDATAI